MPESKLGCVDSRRCLTLFEQHCASHLVCGCLKAGLGIVKADLEKGGRGRGPRFKSHGSQLAASLFTGIVQGFCGFYEVKFESETLS